LFSSANGYQAGYAFQAHNSSPNSNALIVPFLDPRPWLPSNGESADSKKKIAELELELGNAKLREQKLNENIIALQNDAGKTDAELKKNLTDQRKRIDSLIEENTRLRDQQPGSNIKNEISNLRDQNQQLVNEIFSHNFRVSNFSNCLTNPNVQKTTMIYLRNLKEYKCAPFADSLLTVRLRTSF
jgi:septal ring factor EnvC (AmiA/AmiB activator)